MKHMLKTPPMSKTRKYGYLLYNKVTPTYEYKKIYTKKL